MMFATHIARPFGRPLGQPPQPPRPTMASRVAVLWHPSYYYGFWPRAPVDRRWAYESPRRF